MELRSHVLATVRFNRTPAPPPPPPPPQVAYHTLSYGDDLGEVTDGGPELLLHVTQEEVAAVGR